MKKNMPRFDYKQISSSGQSLDKKLFDFLNVCDAINAKIGIN